MKAFVRSLEMLPPERFGDVRPSKKREYAFFCYRGQCSRCDDFKRDGKETFESRLPSTTIVVEWNCDSPKRRQTALDSGVESIPSYAFVDSTGKVRTREVV